MFNELKKEDNHFFLISTKDNQFKKKGKLQTGDFERNILCVTCEREILSSYESYGAKVLKGGTALKMVNKDVNGVKVLEIEGVDYEKFKLFVLSFLWKSSISKRPLFKDVDLGADYNEQVRLMLLHGDPGKSTQFPFLIMTYLHHKEIPPDLITQPSKSKIKNGVAYNFLIYGFSYTIFISKNIIPDFIEETTVNEDGRLRIIYASKEMRNLILKGMIGLDIFENR